MSIPFLTIKRDSPHSRTPRLRAVDANGYEWASSPHTDLQDEFILFVKTRFHFHGMKLSDRPGVVCTLVR